MTKWEPKRCEVKGCSKAAIAKGQCSMHYSRVARIKAKARGGKMSERFKKTNQTEVSKNHATKIIDA